MLLKQAAVITLVAGGLAAGGIVTIVLVMFVARAWWTIPFEVLMFGQAPEQPVAFPHTVHAGTELVLDDDGNAKVNLAGEPIHGLGLDCAFCHRNVAEGESAGIPPVEQCVFCHKTIGKELPEIVKLVNAWDNKQPIVWERVHRLPDTVRFVHEAHIRFFTQEGNLLPSGEQVSVAGNVCVVCHGNVAAMEEVKQVRSLKMGDCVDCHRDYGAPTDCTTCHY